MYLQELSGVVVSSVNMTEITISWTEVNSLCSGRISYNVNSSNCRDIMCTTTRNEVTCSNIPIVNMCSFNIYSEVCGQRQTLNNAIAVVLRRTLSNLHALFLHNVRVHDYMFSL